MDFLADQTIPKPSVEEIRALGNTLECDEAETTSERRRLLERAADEGRLLLTCDVAYYEDLFRDDAPVPPGVVCFQLDSSTQRDPANRLAAVLTGEDIDLLGRFTLLDEERLRQKPLHAG